MAQIPPLRRISAEDFTDQAEWIGKLIQPLNDHMERVTNALNKGLTLEENTASKIIDVKVDGTYPVKIAWNLRSRPRTVLVGDWRRVDGANRVVIARTTGNTTSGSNDISSVADTSKIRPGLLLVSSEFPTETHVVAIRGNTVTVSNNATATTLGAALEFDVDSAVQINWSFNQKGELQIDQVTGILPSPTDKYIVTLEVKTG